MKNVIYAAIALCLTVNMMACAGNNQPGDPASPSASPHPSTPGNPSSATPASNTTQDPATKKYDIKSGIITFSSIQTGMGITVKGEDILYFDNFGMLERKDSYKEGKLETSILTDGVDIITLQHLDQTAYKAAKAVRGTEYRFDWNEISQTDRDNGNAKKLPNKTIAGKPCEAYSLYSKALKNTTEFAGWNHICMYTQADLGGMKNTITATKVQENVPVPADKFQVPAGYKMIQ
jgi:hypothetical protein